MIYKFRAECLSDVGRLLDELYDVEQIRITSLGALIGDVEVVIHTTIPLSILRDTMRSIPDGHVMAETVNLHNKYTGERS